VTVVPTKKVVVAAASETGAAMDGLKLKGVPANPTSVPLLKTIKLLKFNAPPVACTTPPAAPNVIVPLPRELLPMALLPALTLTTPEPVPAVKLLIVVPPA